MLVLVGGWQGLSVFYWIVKGMADLKSALKGEGNEL